MIKKFLEKWRVYKYRFVPWIVFNLNERTTRSVQKNVDDDVMSKSSAISVLESLFNAFELCTHGVQHQSQVDNQFLQKQNLKVLYDIGGFEIARRRSQLQHGGTGVFVTSGRIPEHTIVAIYPGTLYHNYEPILLQSISNPFIFRCIDGLLIDGNGKGISKYLYRSCGNRDRVGPFLSCDMSWLTPFPVNPLAIGQYVNNESKVHKANVAYHEVDIPKDFPFHLRKYIPNIYYGANIENPDVNRLTRVVILVSLRTIERDEELFSTYFTVVH